MRRFFKTLATFTFALLLILMMGVGGAFSAGMMISDHGMMQDCPFMGVAALCNMTPLAHLSQWQAMFTATSQQFSTALFLLMLLALALMWRITSHIEPSELTRTLRTRYFGVSRIFDALRLAFARGIIHTKVF